MINNSLKKTKSLCLKCLLLFSLVYLPACQFEAAPKPETVVTQDVLVSIATTLPTITVEPMVVTRQLTATRALTIMPMSSPSSTLSLREKEDINSGYYEANENCDLPCWWGIIPGETDWLTMQQLLNPITSEIHILAKESEADLNFVVVAYFPVPKILSEIKLLEQSYRIDNGKITIIQPEIPRNMSQTIISEVLRIYGQPSEVWLDTYGYSLGEVNPFRLVLFYPDKGILVRYFDDADFQNEQVVGCFSGHTGAIVLWDPELNLTFAEALNGTRALGTYGEQYYKPLEDATEMSVETLYQTYLDPDTGTCIETPTELWMDR